MKDKFTMDDPIEDVGDVPAGTYRFEVVEWTPHKEELPIGPNKMMCQSVNFRLKLSEGANDNAEVIEGEFDVNDVFKLVEKLKYVLSDYFAAIGERKHGDPAKKCDYSVKRNVGSVGWVRVYYREGSIAGRKFRSLKFLPHKEQEDNAGV